MQQALDQLDRLECIMDPEHARKVAVLGLPWETRWVDSLKMVSRHRTPKAPQ